MLKHLQKMHKSLAASIPVSAPTPDSCAAAGSIKAAIQKMPPSKRFTDGLNKALVMMVTVDYLPLAIVEKRGRLQGALKMSRLYDFT